MTDHPSATPTASNQERSPAQDAGRDENIAERLARDPESVQARLDEALDETMDASDPVSLTAPNASKEPPIAADQVKAEEEAAKLGDFA